MNYPEGLYDLEAFVNSQRNAVPLSNFVPNMRQMQYSGNLSKEAQNFQTSLGYFQNQPYRTSTRDEQDYSMYESSHLNRIDDNLRYQYANNNGLLDFMQQRKAPNNVQIMSANPQIPPLRSEMARLEEAHKKRNVRPQSLNVPGKSLPSNMDIINLESDESLAQMLQSVRANNELLMAAANNRSMPYGLQNDELAQAMLYNQLNYGKANTDYLMPQIPMENLFNGISDYDLLSGISPMLVNAISANNQIYKQMQRELLPGLSQEQQLLLQLGQAGHAGHNVMPDMSSVKSKKPLLTHEPILIDDDSPGHDAYAPMVNMVLDKDRRVVKEEFLTKPSKAYPVFEEIDDRRGMEIPPQYFQGRQPSLNNKRFLNDRDPETQLMGTPEKKFEANNGKSIRTNPNQNANINVNANVNVMAAQPFQADLKKIKKDVKLPVKKEKQPVVMQKERPEMVKQDVVKQMNTNLTVNAPANAVNTVNVPVNIPVNMPIQVVKRPELPVQDYKRDNKPTETIINNNNNKPKELIQPKKVLVPPKIQIEKLSLPENVGIQQQPEPAVENIAKVKQSPTMLYLHNKHGQIQINPPQAPPVSVEQVNRQSLQLKLVSGPTVKIESSTEFPGMSNEYTQGPPMMMSLLNVNQSPEKLMEFRDSPYQSLAAEPLEEEKLSANGDGLVQGKEKTVGRRKKTEPVVDVGPEPAKKERKMNKLQMIRFAYQSYLEEIKKPYKISIHIDPENLDEKINYAKVGEGYQVDVETVLYNRQFTKKHNQLAPSWNPDSIHPKKLEEYYHKFGQMIGLKITNEEAALKNLQKFDMDVEKALDNASRNKLYYQNFFRLDQRVLRNRVSYVS